MSRCAATVRVNVWASILERSCWQHYYYVRWVSTRTRDCSCLLVLKSGGCLTYPMCGCCPSQSPSFSHFDQGCRQCSPCLPFLRGRRLQQAHEAHLSLPPDARNCCDKRPAYGNATHPSTTALPPTTHTTDHRTCPCASRRLVVCLRDVPLPLLAPGCPLSRHRSSPPLLLGV